MAINYVVLYGDLIQADLLRLYDFMFDDEYKFALNTIKLKKIYVRLTVSLNIMDFNNINSHVCNYSE